MAVWEVASVELRVVVEPKSTLLPYSTWESDGRSVSQLMVTDVVLIVEASIPERITVVAGTELTCGKLIEPANGVGVAPGTVTDEATPTTSVVNVSSGVVARLPI